MGFWKTLGKIGAIAAPIVAAPFTGGASLALIGAGAGAAGGALSGGGLKGALMGAGLGAIPGLGGAGSAAKGATNVAGSGFTSILKTIGKNALTNPDVLGAIASTASGAAKGQADQRVTQGNQTLNYAELAQRAANDKAVNDRNASQDSFDAASKQAQFERENKDRERKSAVLQQLLGNTKDFSITPGNPAIAKAMGTSTGGARPSNLTTNSEALMALLSQPQTAAPTYTAPKPYEAPTLPTAPKAGLGENILGGIGLGGNFLAALGQYKNGGWQDIAETPTPQTPSLWAGLPQSPQLMPQAVADPNNPAAVNAELIKHAFGGGFMGGQGFLDPNKLGGDLIDTATGQVVRRGGPVTADPRMQF